MKIGIVGLPNVGKSTLFKALTKKQVDISNYPFCTIEPNIGIVPVPDIRLEKLTQARLLIRFPGSDGQVRYDANLTVHHHIICRSCHRVCDVKIQTPLSSLGLIDDKSGEPIDNWTFENAAIELKGLCPTCTVT